MAKRSRAPKIHEEEEEHLEQLSINNEFEDKESEELMSVNRALEQEKEQSTEDAEVEEPQRLADLQQQKEDTTDPQRLAQLEEMTEKLLFKRQKKASEEEAAKKGITIPAAKAPRDTRKDKDPIEGEDLGLQENDFLLNRKVTKEELEIHNNKKKANENFLGSNLRKPRDLIEVFRRGSSTKETPKIDTIQTIENNYLLQKEIAATQLLRNYHSRDSKEKQNMQYILEHFNLKEEVLAEIKDDKKAHKNQNLIDIIKEMF